MEDYKKEANAEFFKKVIELTSEGGKYVYPHAGETYTVVGGVLFGTKRGVKILKNITPEWFHRNIQEEVDN